MKKIYIILFILFFCVTSYAQKELYAFWNEIQSFKKEDSINSKKLQQILFVGSSSFTNWKNVQTYFPDKPIVNRGFGGSSLSDVIYYANDIIFPYKPKQIVMYCGENDIAGDTSVTAAIVFDKFKTLFTLIRSKLPTVPFVYIAIKPSPSRWHMRARMIALNKMIANFIKKQKKASMIHVWDIMLDENKLPNKDIFLEDDLHMNEKGYALWQKLIAPTLLK